LRRPDGTIVLRNEGVLRRVEEARNSLHAIKRRKANWNCFILSKNCLIKHAIEGKIEGRIEVTRGRERRRKQLLKNDRMLEFQKGSPTSHSVHNSLWKRVWTCHKTDGGTNA